VLPVLSCAPRSMHGNVPVYHSPSQPLTPSHLSCPSCCIFPAWRLYSLQSPTLTAISIQATKTSIQSPVRRFKKAGCTHSLESGRSSRTRTKTNAKNDNDSHSSCLLLTASSLRCASDFNRPSFAKSKAKQGKATKCQISRVAHEPRRAQAFQDSFNAFV
jgi:Fe-S-cluster containining protein